MNKTILALCFTAAFAVSLHAAPFGTAFTYQGRLDDGGAPANGFYDLRFGLFTGPSNADPQVGSTLAFPAVAVSNGLFTVKLNFGDHYPGDPRWLGIEARTNDPTDLALYEQLDPRQELTPQPYAIFAGTAATVTNQAINTAQIAPGAVTAPELGTAGAPGTGQVLTYDGSGLAWTTPAGAQPAWLLNGNGGTDPNVNFLGTTDNVALVVRVNNSRALLIEPDATSPTLVAGHPANSAVAAPGSTVGGGGSAAAPNFVIGSFNVIAGGEGNTNSSGHSFIGGGLVNQVETNGYNVLVGGYNNRIQSSSAFLGGGTGNLVAGAYGTLAGGLINSAVGVGSVVAGGRYNLAWGQDSIVAGGSNNMASAMLATVSGGQDNLAAATDSAIGGGHFNSVLSNAVNSVIAGGYGNLIQISSANGAIGGGAYNQIFSGIVNATISGGTNNLILPGSPASGIGGGEENDILGGSDHATIGGGVRNSLSGSGSVVGGGAFNRILTLSQQSVISGGLGNTVNDAFYAMLGGGYSNVMTSVSDYSGTLAGARNVIKGAEYASIIAGSDNTNTGAYAVVLGGKGLLADKYGQVAFGSRFATNGDAQACFYHLHGTSTPGVTNEVFLDGSLARLVLSTNSAWSFDALVVAKTVGGTFEFGGVEAKGLVVNDLGTLYIFSTTSPLGVGVGTFTVIPAVDQVHQALIFKVSCSNTGTTRWSIQLRTAEVNAPGSSPI
jgi:hypothetical protein